MRFAITMAKRENDSRKNIVGAEIGVDQGIHALEILNEWKEVKTLHLVDSYCCRPWGNYGDARVRLEKFKDRIKWHLRSSAEAILLLDDNSLDFVYIDAGHSYKDVIADCLTWYQKVKKGGVLCGHDYRLDWEDMRAQSPVWKNTHGVVTAVNEFVKIRNLKLGTKTDGSSSDWWVIK